MGVLRVGTAVRPGRAAEDLDPPQGDVCPVLLGDPAREQRAQQVALFHKEAFGTGGISVTPGAQYVVFASIDKDFEQCAGGYVLGWADVSDTVYSGGTFVYQNNGGDESQWTATPWTTFGFDLALKVFMT